MKIQHGKITGMIWVMAAMLHLPACSPGKHILSSRKPFTILGLGDSITEGGPDFFSYLFPLDSMLKAKGCQQQFIGPRVSVLHGDTIHHSGYSGRNAEYLAARADSIYSLYPADLVLLHAGHNHFIEEAPVAGIIRAQQKIIQTIRQKNPSATIIVAAVITAGKLPKYSYIPSLNGSIRQMVEAYHDVHIRFVDQQQAWDWEKYTITDKVHPNKTGADIIASRWLGAIEKIIKK